MKITTNSQLTVPVTKNKGQVFTINKAQLVSMIMINLMTEKKGN